MKKVLTVLVVLFTVLLGWTIWGNTALMVSNYTISRTDLPTQFEGFKILQVSDLHNAEFGEGNGKLLALLREQQPDLIALTGDLVDASRTDVDVAADFAAACADIAPTYFVTGNHEYNIPDGDYAELEERLTTSGVYVLRDELAVVEREGGAIALVGLDDPAFNELKNHLITETVEEYGFTVLLAHRPEYFHVYTRVGAALTLSGHAHGGQFRLPFVGGLIAPGQGFFPEYDAGVYSEGDCTMVVSRGLGNSIIPLRFNNRPELVVITLEKQTP